MIGSTRASRLYRQMLVMARALPEARRAKATTQIMDGFHAGRDEDAAERVTELLHDATKRLSFMRTLVPPHLRPDFADGTQQGFQQYVVRDGRVEDGAARRKEKAKYSNWRQGNLDPDDVAKHHDQMRRFQFMDRPGGPPTGPVWG
ncbi:hypothetical protein FNF28_01023 [Cafeteria roenbergensis]|uniref:Complex 1 LYR protein domain-containing protein n=1 Tax=Cafeteria roenbergensis TaxID=33653 RepID=A0A5A8E0Y7_CAFRO|nr:hypothetical protein FNF28_01023 [Cafeteria roenbergensis]